VDRCIKITDEGLSTLSESLKRLNRLESLTLDGCENRGLTSVGLNNLCMNLKRSNCMQFINLNLSICAITDLKVLGKCLKRLVCLREIQLEFNQCYDLAEKSLKNLNEAMQKLDCLKTFKLGYFCGVICDDDLKSFGGEWSSSLEHLDLNFRSLEKITDDGLSHLCEFFQRLECLKVFKLHLMSKNVSDYGLMILSHKLMSPFLQSLDLNFYSCNITDKGLTDFMKVLPGFGCLEVLKMDFSWTHISNASLLTIQESLEKCTRLRSVKLRFSPCKKVKRDAINNLCKILQDKGIGSCS